MAINPNRKIITYENIALLQSDIPAHSSASNSASNLSFLPLVQEINFSVGIPRTNVGQLGSKSFIDQSNRSAPDVNFNVSVFEDFGNLFSGLFSGSGVRDNLNIDRNFMLILTPKKETMQKQILLTESYQLMMLDIIVLKVDHTRHRVGLPPRILEQQYTKKILTALTEL